MRQIWMILFLMAAPVQAQDSAVQVINGIRLIDASKLSVAELQALAAAERANATHINCCDWGGNGCDPERARATMGWGERLSRLAAHE